jgi:hypothetical protein
VTAGGWPCEAQPSEALKPAARPDASLALARFAAGAGVRHCDGRCCQWGVSVDVAERDRIFTHTTLVQGAMDAGQQRDPATWFDPGSRLDADFPSGRAVRTTLPDNACVFRNTQGRCVLHSLRDATGARLKPFRCRAYPLIVEQGVALVDPDSALRPLTCCGTGGGGPLTVREVCPDEVALVLDPGDVEDVLRRLDASSEQV